MSDSDADHLTFEPGGVYLYMPLQEAVNKAKAAFTSEWLPQHPSASIEAAQRAARQYADRYVPRSRSILVIIGKMHPELESDWDEADEESHEQYIRSEALLFTTLQLVSLFVQSQSSEEPL